ncbi:hypothetical protein AAG906_021892 [Vitis piasezkii]
MGVSEFLQTIKARVDELAILGAVVDDEDLLEKILEGLGEDYKELLLFKAPQRLNNPTSLPLLILPIVPTLGHETCHTLILPPETTQAGVHPPILAIALRAGARRPPLVIDSLHPLALTIYVQIAALQSLILATAKSAEFKDIQQSVVPLSD